MGTSNLPNSSPGADFGRISPNRPDLGALVPQTMPFLAVNHSTPFSRSVRHPGSGQSAIAPTSPPAHSPAHPHTHQNRFGPGSHRPLSRGLRRVVGAYCSSPVYSASAPAPSPSAASNRQGWASAARSSRPRHARAPRPVGPSTIGRDCSPRQGKGPPLRNSVMGLCSLHTAPVHYMPNA